MFTGIIEELGQVLKLEREIKGGARIKIKSAVVNEDLAIGDSIAVNGACLTVSRFEGTNFVADIMPETLRKINLAALVPGSTVNLERAIPATGRFGGHIVSGHIDGTGKIRSRKSEGNAIVFTFEALPEVLRYIVTKGSIAVDGISLTVADVCASEFSVSVIPHTADHTTLGGKEPGDIVNLEVDIIGKYIEKLFITNFGIINRGSPENITLDFLREKGFLTT